MKFKLDENLGHGTLAAFEAAGHDVSSIHLQSLDGAPDDQVFEVCRTEGRVLVTCDLDFANPLVHDPRSMSGVAVLRLPNSPGPSDVQSAVASLLTALAQHDITRALWVIRADRVRVWTPPAND
jgi:predicted nuclease of predicted toxin-antitoxin system